MNRLLYILFLFFLLGNHFVFAQKELKIDTLKTNQVLKNKSTINPLAPSKAAFYSAIFPGMGQVYNKKYWKLPIVYGAIGTGVYVYIWNNKKYNQYRNAYKQRLAGEADEFQFLDESRLIQGQKFYQKNRDLSALITAALYILNIVDANIDAHLMQFNVNDDLSFRPDIQQNDLNNQQNVAITFSYHF